MGGVVFFVCFGFVGGFFSGSLFVCLVWLGFFRGWWWVLFFFFFPDLINYLIK